jgi:hypothetical protein
MCWVVCNHYSIHVRLVPLNALNVASQVVHVETNVVPRDQSLDVWCREREQPAMANLYHMWVENWTHMGQ